ncbi:hypothetical protein ACFQVC_40220 [Streptomyces monticola]|uniref:Uncharacterized protein n=1 Tax=Streptomyces monticola TaxID=2666263 RepID=A0ABW2JYD5_9ACTN
MTPGRRLGRRNRPVFIERSGHRRRLMRSLAAMLGCACAGYLVFFFVVFDALQQPAGKAPPRMDEPLPTSNARHDSRIDADEPGGSAKPRPRTSPATPTDRPSTRPATPRAER